MLPNVFNRLRTATHPTQHRISLPGLLQWPGISERAIIISSKLTSLRRYLHDEALKNDPVQQRGIFEELKIEAAMIAIVSSVHAA